LLAGPLAFLAASVCFPAELPSDSIYQLRAQLTTQTATSAGLDLHRGHPTLISMFYGSCPAACPMLITALQVYESHLDEPSQARLRVLLVSFDPQRDTPEQLDRLARLHRADLTAGHLRALPSQMCVASRHCSGSATVVCRAVTSTIRCSLRSSTTKAASLPAPRRSWEMRHFKRSFELQHDPDRTGVLSQRRISCHRHRGCLSIEEWESSGERDPRSRGQ
jgi:SCO1/SenC